MLSQAFLASACNLVIELYRPVNSYSALGYCRVTTHCWNKLGWLSSSRSRDVPLNCWCLNLSYCFRCFYFVTMCERCSEGRKPMRTTLKGVKMYWVTGTIVFITAALWIQCRDSRGIANTCGVILNFTHCITLSSFKRVKRYNTGNRSVSWYRKEESKNKSNYHIQEYNIRDISNSSQLSY